METNDRLFTLRQVAERYNLSERSLADAARAGKMPHYRLHGRRYMSRAQIDEYLASSLVGPKPLAKLSDAEVKAKFLRMHNRRTSKE